ncbi:MAG TPA: glycosyltransferase [Herpetosiphonaceae bacterium]
MRVLITTFGTRGDIQPFIALAQGLQAAGHTTAICTADGFQPMLAAAGITHLSMNNALLELTQAALSEVTGLADAIRISGQMRPAIRQAMDDEWQAARDWRPDLIVFHPKCLGSAHIAGHLQLPAVLAIPLPFYTATRSFPVPFLPVRSLSGPLNRWSYQFNRLTSLLFARTINDFRQRTLGQRPISRFADALLDANGRPFPILYPYSPAVLPTPPDFPPHVHVTGYWFLAQGHDWTPPADLAAFLAAGNPPVVVGFGSMQGAHAAARTHAIIQALQTTGQRGILLRGWGGLTVGDLPPTIMALDEAPHEWLLPQAAAVAHHGGAGTTAAGVRAGIPSIICPFLGDQPFWGRVIHQRGVGPAPIPQRQLTAERFAAAIQAAVTDQGMRDRAARLGAAVRAEDGVGQAARIFQSFAMTP